MAYLSMSFNEEIRKIFADEAISLNVPYFSFVVRSNTDEN